MTNTFLTILNMSMTASYVILCIILIRLLLKKAPKIFSYGLWSVAGFRLLCPFSFKSILSLVPMNTYQQASQIKDIAPASGLNVRSSIPAPSAITSTKPMPMHIRIGAYIWLAGIVVMLIYSVVSMLILKNRLQNAHHKVNNIYESAGLKTPFVLGIFKPYIYIPEELPAEETNYIIRHEQTHIRRFDHIIKPFAFMALSIHWFNPLVWAAFFLMSNDMELSCDERVLEEMGVDIKKAYSMSLLSLATKGRIINGSPLAFGESNVGGRIKNVLSYKKPTLWIVLVAIIIVVLAGIGLVSNPKTIKADENSYADEIYKYRTQYVGDNSKVINITASLPVPDTLKYSQIRLLMDKPPYGIEVTYKTTPEAMKSFSNENNQAIFDRDSILMFSLIKNADYVNFVLNDGNNKLSVGRTREWANNAMDKDLWKSSATQEMFNSLYLEIIEK